MTRLRRSDTSAAGLRRVRQYLYHDAWRARRDREKHDHVLAVAECLPAARDVARTQLLGRGLSRERVLAAAFTLLDVDLFRIGWPATQGEFEAAVIRLLRD